MAVVLVGCAGTGQNARNIANLSTLSLGMTKAQVLGVMGAPGRGEAATTKDGDSIEYLFYRTGSGALPGVPRAEWERRQWVPVIIIDGELKGWGNNFYDATRNR